MATTCGGSLFADERGSVVAVTDNVGNVTAINAYDEYGIPKSGNAGRFQYTGQAWLPDLGMYYYKARMYSPTLGRFMQVDPIGYDDQFNLYAYIGNDPVNGVDPSGEAGVIGAIIGAGIEIANQASTGEIQSSWSEAADRISNGDVLGAARAVGASTGKIAVSAGAGALGAGLAGQAMKATITVSRANQAAGVARAAAAGAVAGGVERVGHNAVDGRPLTAGAARAAAGGAVGGGVGRAAGQAAAQRTLSGRQPRVDAVRSSVERGHQRALAAEASQRSANRTEGATAAGWSLGSSTVDDKK